MTIIYLLSEILLVANDRKPTPLTIYSDQSIDSSNNRPSAASRSALGTW